MKKIIFATILMFSFAGISNAQLATDILKYSFTDYTGTARSLGTANSMSALGGDYTAVGLNPAGLATFKFSEFSFGTGLNINRTNALLTNGAENLSFDDSATPVSINHAHYVVADYDRTKSGWRGVAFGLGFNRLADFNQRFNYRGLSAGTITDRFTSQADGFIADDLNSFEEGLAYEVGAIFPSGDDETFYLNDFEDGDFVDKRQTVRTKGSLNEFSISLAGNYEDKLFIGGNLNFHFLNYNERKVYSETNEVLQNNPIFNDLSFEEELDLTGNGVNLKLGFIYMPVYNVRIGGAIQTPTSMGMEESYETSLRYSYNYDGTVNDNTALSPEGFFTYRVISPFKANLGAAFIHKKVGFLSFSAEYLDYGTSSFDFDNTLDQADLLYEDELNTTIRNNFSKAWNLKAGGEIRLDDLRFRFGAGYLASPFGGNNVNRTHFNGGIGIFSGATFVDLGAEYSIYSEEFVPYAVSNDYQQSVDLVQNNLRIALTLGFKFR